MFVKAVCVDPARVSEVWPSVAPWIRTAIERGRLASFDVIERDVRDGRSFLWLVWDGNEVMAAAVTELSLDGEDKICTIVACGGHDMERWGFLIGELEQFAMKEGCKAMRIYGRQGWKRLLPEYRTQSVVLEKELA